MTTKKKPLDPLPKRIYAKWEQPQNGPDFLTADETPDSMEDGDIVGIYQLVETRTMKVTRDLK